MRRSTVRRTALCVSLLSFTAIFAILGNTKPVAATAVAGVTLPSIPAPWVAVAASIQFATSINWYIKMFKLLLQLLTGGGKDAACDLCDEVVTVMLELDDTKDSMELEGDSLCDNICPFKIARCVNLCTRLLDAIQSSTKFPCEAIGVCASLDEFGDEPECKWHWASGCQPHALCARSQTLPFPKCDLKPGKKKWKRLSKAMTENVGALANAVKSLPKCGEPGAHEVFCVDEPTGVHLVAEYLGYVLIFVVATAKSIYAIETRGGDDDRQWLSFWMIFFLFTSLERFTDVILSRFPIYYECKLLVLIYLILFDGAAGLYFYVHGAVRFLQRHLFRFLSSMLAPADDGLEVQDYMARRIEEKDDDEARGKLSEQAIAYAAERLKAFGFTGAERLDHFEAKHHKEVQAAVEGAQLLVAAAIERAKVQEREQASVVSGGGVKLPALLDRLKAARDKLQPLRLPDDKKKNKPVPSDQEVTVERVREAEAAVQAAAQQWRRLRDLRNHIKAALEQANYEYVMANVRSPGAEREGLARVFTEPHTASLPLLRLFLVPLEKMLFRLAGKAMVGKAQGVTGEELGKKGLPGLPAGIRDKEQLQRVIDKTQAHDWKQLEVRYLEVELEELTNVPPMDTDGNCQPFVRLALAQLHGQENHIQVVEGEEVGGAGFKLPRRILSLDLTGPGSKPFRDYSMVQSRVQGRLVAGSVKDAASGRLIPAHGHPRRAIWNQKLELAVEGGKVDAAGEYHNPAAPFHVLVGEVWDKDVVTASDLAGYFQVPLAVLMDGLAHQVTAQVELTEEGKKSVDVGKKKAAKEAGHAFLEDKPITVTMTLQFAP